MLDRLVRDRSLNTYVRWEAASAYLYLVREGCLSPEAAVDCLHRQLREAIGNADADAAGFLVLELTDFAARETWNDIREAFRLDLIDEMLIDLEYVDECLEQGETHFQSQLESCRPTTAEDTVDAIQRWAMYGNGDETGSEEGVGTGLLAAPESVDDDWGLSDDEWEPEATIHNARPRIGRNDPCPCGSGRKFKKCCGSR